MDDLFELLPEGTRIVIHGNKVTFENLTPDMVDVAHELSPDFERPSDPQTNAAETKGAETPADPVTPAGKIGVPDENRAPSE